MGASPRTVDSVVNISGRKRDIAASTAACRTGAPRLRSSSICAIKMTAFLAIIPSKARTPRRRQTERLLHKEERCDNTDQTERHDDDTIARL